MLVGLCLFLNGFINLLNHYLNLRQSKNDNYPLKKSLNSFKKYSSTPNQTKFYYYILNDDTTATTTNLTTFQTSLFIWYCKTEIIPSNDDLIMVNLNLNGRINNNYNSTFKQLVNFIVCSSEKIFIFLFIFLCLIGIIAIIYGCLTFYKYNIQLDNQYNSDDNDYCQIEKEEDSLFCCRKKNNSENERILCLKSKSTSLGDQLPFIYADLPKYLMNNKVNLPSYSRNLESPCFEGSKIENFVIIKLKNKFSREYFV